MGRDWYRSVVTRLLDSYHTVLWTVQCDMSLGTLEPLSHTGSVPLSCCFLCFISIFLASKN